MQKVGSVPKFGQGSEFITERVNATQNNDTVYQLASVSKSYTGVLANSLAAQGKFGEKGLNANLVELFKKSGTEEGMQIAKILEDKGFENITIAQVLNHTSGIGIINYKSIATNPERSAKIIAGERAMSDVEFLKAELPGRGKHWKEPFGYANEGFFLFQKLVDQMPNTKTFKEEMKTNVIEPFGLKDTGFSGELGSKEKKVYNHIPAGETLVSLGAKNTTDGLAKTEANKLLPTGTAIQAAGGLSASMSDLKNFAERIPDVYSDPKIAKQLYNAAFKKDQWIENGVTKNICLYSSGIYLNVQPSEKEGKIRVVFRHSGNLFGGFETNMQSACEYDFKGTPQEFIEAMKRGEKMQYNKLPAFTKAEYEKYDGLAKEALCDSITGNYHVKLLHEAADAAIKSGKITEDQWNEVLENANLVAESGQRYALNMGLQNLGVNTGSLWGKCGEVEQKVKAEIFTQFAGKNGVIDSEKLLKVAENPRDFQALKHSLEEKCLPQQLGTSHVVSFGNLKQEQPQNKLTPPANTQNAQTRALQISTPPSNDLKR